jgi:hypothetical protein
VSHCSAALPVAPQYAALVAHMREEPDEHKVAGRAGGGDMGGQSSSSGCMYCMNISERNQGQD